MAAHARQARDRGADADRARRGAVLHAGQVVRAHADDRIEQFRPIRPGTHQCLVVRVPPGQRSPGGRRRVPRLHA